MGKLYVVRHSLSYYNELGKYAGNQDIPLSKKGIKDSQLLGKQFKKLYPSANIDYVFTSTLSRSFDTAVLMLSEISSPKTPIKISRKRLKTYSDLKMLPIVSFSELNERDYGILQNMDKNQVQKNIDEETLFSWRRNFFNGPRQGESFKRVVSRVAKFYFSVLEPMLKDKDILLVAHQNTIRALYYLIYSIDKEQIKNIEFQNSDIWMYDNNLLLRKKNVIIMASGIGTRLKEYTQDTPKPLLKIGNKEIISYSVDYFEKNEYSISITYSYLKDKWNEFIKLHPDISYCYTDNNSFYWQDFIRAYNKEKNKSGFFVLVSGDMFFDFSIVDDALRFHIINSNKVTVALNEHYGKWKKWKYSFSASSYIKDIAIASEPQEYERYFVIFDRDMIDKFIEISSKNGFITHNEYGSGACFILKTLIDFGVKVNYKIYDNFLVNINDINDYNKAIEHINALEDNGN